MFISRLTLSRPTLSLTRNYLLLDVFIPQICIFGLLRQFDAYLFVFPLKINR